MDSINNTYYKPASKTNGANDVTFVDRNNNSSIDFHSFLNIMITQLKNQDFTNPVNDAEYMSQMAQLSMLQQMQEVTKNSQQGFAASLLGKVVTVSTVSQSGQTKTETGYVDSVSFNGDELKVMVNGSTYPMTSITKIFDNTYYLTELYNNGLTGNNK